MHEKERNSQIGSILLEILESIENHGLSRLADSIWISTRREILRPIESGGPCVILPDTVAELLENTSMKSRFSELFELSWIASGTCLEMWIVERVMHHGSLWYGQAQIKNRFEALGVGKQQGEPSYSSGDTRPGGDDVKSQSKQSKSTIASRLMTRLWTSIMHRQGGLGDDLHPQVSSAAAMTMLTAYMNRDKLGGSYSSDSLAVFDIDGPTTIGIPYDSALEILPRSLERSMSVCWVIERDPSTEVRQPFGIIEGHVEERSGAERTLVSDDQDTRALSDSNDEATVSSEEQDEKIRFKVKGKVRGCWPVIELVPMGSYLFL